MQLFKSKPSLIDGEKARIELHLQQISQCIGAERFSRPVLAEAELLTTAFSSSNGQLLTVEEMTQAIGDHLSHDVAGLTVESLPQQLEKCGGGG